MFNVNDVVLYGNQGVCKIYEISKKDFGNAIENYYVLKPIHQNNSTFFVPVKNQKLVDKMHHLLSIDETNELISSLSTNETIWIEDQADRKTTYQEIISSCDRRKMLQIMKTLYNHKQEQIAKGKKLHFCDENMLRETEKIIFDEFSVVLKISPEDVLPFILQQNKIS